MFPFASRGRWCCSVGSCSFQVIDQVEKPGVLEGRRQVDQLTVRAARAAAALAPGNGPGRAWERLPRPLLRFVPRRVPRGSAGSPAP